MSPPLSAEAKRLDAIRQDLTDLELEGETPLTQDLRFLLDRCVALQRALSQSEKLKATWGDMLTQSIDKVATLEDKVAALTADLDAMIEKKVMKGSAWLNDDGSVSFAPHSETATPVSRWLAPSIYAATEQEYYRFESAREALDAYRASLGEPTNG